LTLVLKIIATCLLGCALGLGLTGMAVKRGPLFGAIHAGAWTSFPRAGDAGDPYARATYARSAEIPLGSGEGLSFLARTDDDGAPLRAGCTYVLHGGTMPARAWTLTVLDLNGKVRADGSTRSGFTSGEVLRTAGGTRFDIALAPQAQPGNWLPTGGDTGRLVLMLRLYDTVLSTGGSLDAGALPAIVRDECA
jgi:hypothetical protein